MKIRIISGTLKGRFIPVHGAGKGFRPTLERMRQAVADSLMERVPGSSAADLCAGSGAFGFELISRGAVKVDFVEINRQRAAEIESRARELGVEDRCCVYAMDLRSFLRKPRGPYDIIFFDPPYDEVALERTVPELAALLSSKGVLLYEHRTKSRNRTDATTHHADRTIECGESAVDFIRPDSQV